MSIPPYGQPHEPTGPPRRRIHSADSSVLLGVRGVPSWAAIVIAIVGGVVGIVLDHTDGTYTLSWGFGLCFVGGIVLAILAVRRGAIFTAMVQAPIVMTILVFATFRLLGTQGTIFSASKIVTSFPIMAIATGAALLLGLVRIIAQPLKYGRDDSNRNEREAASQR